MSHSVSAGPLATMGVSELIATMRDFRGRLLGLVSDLDDRQMIGPRLAIVNPPLWEIGHVAWTQEFWLLRHLRSETPLLADGDRLYNSTEVAHDTRWDLLLPSRESTLAYVNEVIARCVARIENKADLSPEEFYFYWLTTFHEGMHAEALAYTRQTLGYPPPLFIQRCASEEILDPRAFPGDVEIPAGEEGAEILIEAVLHYRKVDQTLLNVLQPDGNARAPVTDMSSASARIRIERAP